MSEKTLDTTTLTWDVWCKGSVETVDRRSIKNSCLPYLLTFRPSFFVDMKEKSYRRRPSQREWSSSNKVGWCEVDRLCQPTSTIGKILKDISQSSCGIGREGDEGRSMVVVGMFRGSYFQTRYKMFFPNLWNIFHRRQLYELHKKTKGMVWNHFELCLHIFVCILMLFPRS